MVQETALMRNQGNASQVLLLDKVISGGDIIVIGRPDQGSSH